TLEVAEREVDTPIIEFSRADLAPQTLEHGANRVQRGSMAMIGRERGHSRTVHQLIHRREQTEEIFLSSFLHREIIPRTECHEASISGFVPLPKPSQRMQVGQQISHLLGSEHLAVTRHVLAAMADDVEHPLVIRGKAAHRKILMGEQALQSRTFLVYGQISLVT